MNLIEICTEQNFFTYENNIYILEQGIAMGSPLSSFLADIYMSYIEEKIEKLNLFKFIKYWGRYVDDILVIWYGNEENLNTFYEHINNISINLNFTLEKEKDNKLNFLDLTLIKKNNRLEFNIFRKPTNTDLIIPYDSSHHISQKLSTFQSLYYRAYNLPLNEEGLNKELKIIKQLASKNNYPLKIIQKIENKHKTKAFIKSLKSIISWTVPYNTDIESKQQTIYKSLSYYKETGNKLEKNLKKTFHSTRIPIQNR